MKMPHTAMKLNHFSSISDSVIKYLLLFYSDHLNNKTRKENLKALNKKFRSYIRNQDISSP
ncbi:hypothetical protein ACZ87_02475 [Candidatus Erwinia dacicola]|uniref:Uncharacterized protein n=1 Tax=Candidatus Erwinia dacicola TaxID=252393 RepID=A0A328TJQ9_9GAMM|nr:hypothetical protein ACZ87_02475 [Candidatus Erwinia dacicola]